MEGLRSTSASIVPVPDKRAVEAPGKSGKNLPPAGNTSPPPAEPVDVKRAVEQIQSYLSSSQRSLQFRVTEHMGRPVMVVTNPATGEVIRQIPGEEVQKMAAAITRGGGQLLDTVA